MTLLPLEKNFFFALTWSLIWNWQNITSFTCGKQNKSTEVNKCILFWFLQPYIPPTFCCAEKSVFLDTFQNLCSSAYCWANEFHWHDIFEISREKEINWPWLVLRPRRLVCYLSRTSVCTYTISLWAKTGEKEGQHEVVKGSYVWASIVIFHQWGGPEKSLNRFEYVEESVNTRGIIFSQSKEKVILLTQYSRFSTIWPQPSFPTCLFFPCILIPGKLRIFFSPSTGYIILFYSCYALRVEFPFFPKTQAENLSKSCQSHLQMPPSMHPDTSHPYSKWQVPCLCWWLFKLIISHLVW